LEIEFQNYNLEGALPSSNSCYARSMLTMTWAELKERYRNHEELSETERREASLACDELESIFENQFFDVKHSLFSFFLNSAAWPAFWLIWFGNLLKSLKQHPDFTPLVADLQNPKKYGERMSILEIADILRLNGFSFSLDKEVRVNGVSKKPDLFVSLDANDPGFFIEVASLNRGHKERQAHKVFDALQQVFWPHIPQILFSGRCERVLSDIHLKHVVEIVQKAVQSAVNVSGFETVEIEGVLHLAMATKANEGKLEQWSRLRGLEAGEFAGPGAPTSEIARLSIKLQEEQKQLPTDRSGVIVIYSHLFCSTPGTLQTFQDFAQSIEEEIYRFPNVRFVILIFRWMGLHKSEVISFRDHICVNRHRFDFICDTSMIFKNRFAEKTLPAAIEDQFLAAFKTGASAK